MNEAPSHDAAREDARRAGLEEDKSVVPFSVSPTMTLVLEARNLERRLEKNLQEVGLNLRKFGIMGHLSSNPGLSFTDIADRAGITVQSVHTIVSDLMKSGWVTTDGMPGRGRAATLRLSDAGVECMDAARQTVGRIDEEVFGISTGKEWQNLASALRGVAYSRLRTRSGGTLKGTKPSGR